MDLMQRRRLLMMDALREYQVTGNPVSFNTNVAKPLRGLSIPFLPVQTGSGDPSPSNVRPITGWDGVTVNRTGANIFDPSTITRGYINSSGQLSSVNQNACSDYIEYPANASLLVTVNELTGNTLGNVGIAFFDRNKNYIKREQKRNSSTPVKIDEAVMSEPGYIRIWIEVDGDAHTVEEYQAMGLYAQFGSDFAGYSPYVGISYPISFPSTIYGGTLDAVNGVVTKTWGSFDLGALSWQTRNNGSIYYFYATLPQAVTSNMWTPDAQTSLNNYPPHFISDRFKTVSGSYVHSGSSGDNAIGMDWPYTVRLRCDTYEHDADAFKTAMNGVTVLYEYATAVTAGTVSALSIPTLIGDNVVWTDTNGQNVVTYLKRG